jgi:DNA-binding MarR family transcriptional regulator
MKASDTGKPAAPLTNRTLFAIQKLGQLVVAQVEAVFAEIGLSARDYFILAGIDQAAPISQQDLSRLLSIDPTTMVALIDDLQRRKLVERTRNATDRRRYDLTLTPRGRTDVKTANRLVDKVEREFLRILTPEEKAAYRAISQKLVQDRWN